ncbi:hypothetical protein KR044_001634 [Drosophila immigrans]|nr:hypothetical protein KR044_001634 [Drosophila immigrans]
MSPRPVGIGFECGRKPPKMRFRWPPPPSPSMMVATSASASTALASPATAFATATTTTTTANRATSSYTTKNKTKTITQQEQQQHIHSKHWSIIPSISSSSKMSSIAVLLLAIVALNNLDCFLAPATAAQLGETRLRQSPTGN